MSKEFRTRLRVKQWKYAAILAEFAKKARPVDQMPFFPQIVPPWPVTSKCARCGMDWPNGPMAYCCPHGSMCGIPLTSSPNGWPPVVYQNPRMWGATVAGKADIWN